MSELIEKASRKTVDSSLNSTEVKRLAEAGVEVESDDDEGSAGGGEGIPNQDEQEEDEQEQTGAGGSGDEEEQEQQSDEDLVDQLGSDSDSFDEEDLDEMVEQSEVAGEDVSQQDAEERADALEAAGVGAGSGSGRLVDDHLENVDAESEWVREAKKVSRPLKRMLDDYLRQERKTEISRGESHGSFDSTKMISASRGSQDVFMRRNKPGEKKYHAVLFMDDSGSMGRERLHPAAVATGSITRALEEVGISVTVYRFARRIRLVKTADQEYQDAEERILENQTHGGTKLSSGLEQVSDLAEQFGDETFVMVMTDGKPSASERVKELLEDMKQTNMCLQIETDHDEFRESYDGFAFVKDSSEIKSQAQSLFRRVML